MTIPEDSKSKGPKRLDQPPTWSWIEQIRQSIAV